MRRRGQWHRVGVRDRHRRLGRRQPVGVSQLALRHPEPCGQRGFSAYETLSAAFAQPSTSGAGTPVERPAAEGQAGQEAVSSST